jgi:hypothetical protein
MQLRRPAPAAERLFPWITNKQAMLLASLCVGLAAGILALMVVLELLR